MDLNKLKEKMRNEIIDEVIEDKDRKIKLLEEELLLTKNNLGNMCTEYENLNEEYTKAYVKIKMLQDQKNALTSQNDGLIQKCEKLENKINDTVKKHEVEIKEQEQRLEQEKERMKNEAIQMVEKLSTTELQRDGAIADLGEAKNHLKEANHQIELLKKEIDELSTRLMQKIERLEKTNTELTEDNSKLQEEKKNLEDIASSNDIDKQIKDLKSKYEKIIDNNNKDSEKTITDLKLQLKELTDKLESNDEVSNLKLEHINNSVHHLAVAIHKMFSEIVPEVTLDNKEMYKLLRREVKELKPEKFDGATIHSNNFNFDICVIYQISHSQYTTMQLSTRKSRELENQLKQFMEDNSKLRSDLESTMGVSKDQFAEMQKRHKAQLAQSELEKQEEVNKVIKDLAEAKQFNSTLQGELNAVQKQLDEIFNKQKEILGEMKRKEKEIATTKDDLKKYINLFNDSQTNLNGANEDIETLKQEVEQNKIQLNEKENIINQYTKDLQSKENEIDQMKVDLKLISEKFESCDKEIKAQLNQIKNKDSKINQLQSQLDELVSSIEFLNNSLNDEKDKINKLNKSIHDKEETNRRLLSEFKSTDLMNKELTFKVEKLESELVKRIAELRIAQSSLTTLETQEHTIKSELATKKAEVESLTQFNQTLAEDMEKITMLYQESEESNATNAQSLDELQKRLNESEFDREAFRKDLGVMREDILYYKEKCVQLNDNLSGIAEKFNQSKVLIEECFDDMKQLNLDLSTIDEPAVELKMRNITGNMNAIEERFKNKNHQLEAQGQSILKMKADLGRLISSMKNKEQTINSRDSEINELRYENDMIRAEVGSFELHLKSLEWELKTHTDSLCRTLAKNDIRLPKGQKFNDEQPYTFENWKERLDFLIEKLKSISFEHLILLDQYIIYQRFKSQGYEIPKDHLNQSVIHDNSFVLENKIEGKETFTPLKNDEKTPSKIDFKKAIQNNNQVLNMQQTLDNERKASQLSINSNNLKKIENHQKKNHAIFEAKSIDERYNSSYLGAEKDLHQKLSINKSPGKQSPKNSPRNNNLNHSKSANTLQSQEIVKNNVNIDNKYNNYNNQTEKKISRNISPQNYKTKKTDPQDGSGNLENQQKKYSIHEKTPEKDNSKYYTNPHTKHLNTSLDAKLAQHPNPDNKQKVQNTENIDADRLNQSMVSEGVETGHHSSQKKLSSSPQKFVLDMNKVHGHLKDEFNNIPQKNQESVNNNGIANKNRFSLINSHKSKQSDLANEDKNKINENQLKQTKKININRSWQDLNSK